MQTISVSILNNFNKAGVFFQRMQNDPSYNSINWNDLSIGFLFRKQFHSITVNAILQGIHSTNYSWIENKNVFNFHGFISLLYYL